MFTSTMPLNEVINLDVETASKLFSRPRKYDHIGIEISRVPVCIPLNKVRRSDDASFNKGRPNGHTPDEKERLRVSFAKEVQLWQELPMVTKCSDPESKFSHDLAIGFGRTNAIGQNNADRYWFWELSGTPVQIEACQAFENTDKLLDVEFQTGEKGVENFMKSLLSKGGIDDDEEEIENTLDKFWPNLNSKSRGRILKAVSSETTTPRRYKTYNQEDVRTWINETASSEYQTIAQGGNFDPVREMTGYSSQNVLDPYIYAIKNFVKTGRKSYLTLSVKAPTKNSSLSTKRQNLINNLNELHESFTQYFGVKENPLIILGFMPQDTVLEDMRFLVDKDGNPIR